MVYILCRLSLSCVSTALLKTFLSLHMPPIKLVVYQRTYQVNPGGNLS